MSKGQLLSLVVLGLSALILCAISGFKCYSPGARTTREVFQLYGKNADATSASHRSANQLGNNECRDVVDRNAAKVVVKPRAIVTAGLANEVDEMNQ
jgi:hypothetical protein